MASTPTSLFRRLEPGLRSLLAGLGLAALILTGCSSSNATGEQTQLSGDGANATVVRVVDGDTFQARISGKTERVRMIGIDTPETVDQNRPVGCYGKEASAFTKSLLPEGASLRLVLDVESRDRFDRILAYVYRSSDNLFVNAEIARQGYANTLTIPPNVAHSDEIGRLVAEARNAFRGLWGACDTR